MSPPKFSSLRYPRRRPSSLVPFRDDLGLVGFRYEKTIQAEPPIPIPARNVPSRSASLSASSPPSSFTSPRPSFTSPNSSPISPPEEEHPALRSDFSSEESRDEWRSDSGAARTTSTTTTIYEEDIDDIVLYDKELGFATVDDSAVAPAVVDHVEVADPGAVEGRSSLSTLWPVFSRESISSPPPQHRATLPASSRTTIPPQQTPDSRSPPSVASPTGASTTAASPRKLGRSFSFKVLASNPLKRKSSSEMGPCDAAAVSAGGEARSGKWWR